jgi:hypothetical protein
MLDDLGEEAGDQEAACRAGVLGAERRHAQALLLARMPASLKKPEAAYHEISPPRTAACAPG